VAQDGKTEKPTPKRLRDARKQGQFARTQDAATWVGIAAGAALLPRSCALLTERFRELLGHRLAAAAADPTPARALDALAAMPSAVLVPLAPVALAALAGALLATASQGVHLTGATLKPKLSRLSPKHGLKRMLGVRAVWEAAKALAKVIVIGTVVVVLGRSSAPELIGPGVMPLSLTVDRTRGVVETLLWATAATGLVLALADYAFQRRTVLKELRMTPREIKDELRQSEGDPLVKGAIRARQLAMSRNRMLSAVAGADVVLVNPTHLAVALKYERGRGAPRVVAKGAGTLALKIRERAREARVPVVEDKPLARTLYRVCDVDDEVPAELYLAIARVLAFVMAAGRPATSAGARRPITSTSVPDLPTKAVLRARRTREARGSRPDQAGEGRRRSTPITPP
jgi:flagellar biosynthesis protein FlhB